MTQTDIGAAAYGWWAHLTNGEIGQSRAALAQLRRASAPIDALLLPTVHDLNQRLAKAGFDLRHQPQKLSLIAMVLAHVKTSAPARLAQQMGRGDPRALSPMRFDRLMRLDDPQELTQQLRRALAVVGQGANVSALAQDLLWWNDATRARWCFDYYGASDAAPSASNEPEFTKESEA